MSAAVPVAAAPSIDLRFAQLIQQFGLTKNSFAISLGKTASVVQHLIEGRNKPGFDLLCRVFEVYPNVSRDWLLLGRGPMLVGSSANARPGPGAEITAPELPLEPIDLTDVAPRVPRRASVGLAGSRLNPADIAATLALATAVAEPGPAIGIGNGIGNSAVDDGSGYSVYEPARFGREANNLPYPPVVDAASASHLAPAPQPAPALQPAPVAPPVPAMAAEAQAAPVPGPPQLVAQALPEAVAEAAVAAAPVAAPLVAPVVPVAPAVAQAVLPPMGPANLPAASPPGPEVYLTAALHAQQLQHQLAMAELRNQHLLEQQQMLREMLAMARQAMV